MLVFLFLSILCVAEVKQAWELHDITDEAHCIELNF